MAMSEGHILWSRGWNMATGFRAVKWCFNCRTYALHWYMLFVDSGRWYEPNPSWKCVYCWRDDTVFPGRERILYD
jgi:hypothetical protein